MDSIDMSKFELYWEKRGGEHLTHEEIEHIKNSRVSVESLKKVAAAFYRFGVYEERIYQKALRDARENKSNASA